MITLHSKNILMVLVLMLFCMGPSVNLSTKSFENLSIVTDFDQLPDSEDIATRLDVLLPVDVDSEPMVLLDLGDSALSTNKEEDLKRKIQLLGLAVSTLSRRISFLTQVIEQYEDELALLHFFRLGTIYRIGTTILWPIGVVIDKLIIAPIDYVKNLMWGSREVSEKPTA